MGAAGSISFLCLLVGFAAGRKRATLFDHEKICKKYGEEHRKHFKTNPPKGGYPDHGDGLYGDMLSYQGWWSFGQDQLTHRFFLENVTHMVFLLLVIGLVYPKVALVWVALHSVFASILSYGHK